MRVFCFFVDLKQELKIQQKAPGSTGTTTTTALREGHDNDDDDEGGHGDDDEGAKDKQDKELMDTNSRAVAREQQLSNESEQEDSNRQETGMTNNNSNGLVNGSSSCNGGATDTVPLVNKASMLAGTRSAAATMQRENSLKRKLISAFASTKRALRPACIFGPRRKRSI